MKPYYHDLADDDTALGWEKVLLAVEAVVLAVQLVVLVDVAHQPPVHVAADEVMRLPIERLENTTPDVMDAMGMAAEAAERMLRLHPATVADDQAWLLNRMVPGLAEAYEKKNVTDIIAMARKVNGEVRATVKSVTPVQARLPFTVEVVVAQEFLGDFRPPGKGRPDPTNARREEYRYVFTLVRTTKSAMNRDALLIRDVSMATTRG